MEEGFKNLSIRRVLLYLTGLLFYALGACLMTRGQVGISPLTSVAYVFTQFTSLSLGQMQFICYAILVLIQALWMGQKFPKANFLQLVASILFSVFVDVIMPFTARFNFKGVSYPKQWITFFAGLLSMAVGIMVVKVTDLILLPSDGTAEVMAYKMGWSFGRAKVVIDCICVGITSVVSLLVLRRIEGIGIGTLVAAVGLGNLVRLLLKLGEQPLQQWLGAEKSS